MSNEHHTSAAAVLASLAEIKADVRWLVEERRSSNKRTDELEDRITKLEHWRGRVLAVASVIGIAVPALVSTAINKLWGVQ